MAGEPIMTALLIGLGVDELSASPPLVPQIKYMVRRLKLSEAQTLAEFALNSESGADILAKCQELAWQAAPSLFESKAG
jgi:phosphotransferase system enzyme I (PtsI)